MSSAAQSMIAAYSQGKQLARQREQDALAEEDRKLQQDLLKHRLAQMKMEDKIREFQTKSEAVQGQIKDTAATPVMQLPADQRTATFGEQTTPNPLAPGEGDEMPTELMSVLSSLAQQPAAVETMDVRPNPVTMPGLPEMGIPERQVQPMSLEDTLRQAAQARYAAMMTTPQKLGPGETFGLPRQPPLMEGGKKSPTYRPVDKLVNGKPMSLGYDPTTNRYIDSQGNPVSDVRPIPPAAAGAGQSSQWQQAFEQMMQPGVGPGGEATPPALVQSALDGKIDPNAVAASNRWTPMQKLQFTNEILKWDPSWSSQRFKLRTAFESGTAPPGKSLVALNTAAAHMDLFYELSTALKNRDVQAANYVINTIRTATGDPRVTNAELAKTALASEIAAFLKGASNAPTDPEIDNWLNQMTNRRSPKQIEDGARTLGTIIVGRMGGLQGQWQRVFGRNNFYPILDPAAQQAFDRIGVSTAKVVGTGGAGSVPPPSAGGWTLGAMPRSITGPDGQTVSFPTDAAFEAAKKEVGLGGTTAGAAPKKIGRFEIVERR